jgi:hypothetical protein
MLGRGRLGCGRWLGLALIVLGMVSQHCVLPTSGETGASHGHHEAASGHGEHEIHAVPCDVVVAKTLSTGPAVPVVSGMVLDRVTTARLHASMQPIANPVVSGAGPPLYILHASLLI